MHNAAVELSDECAFPEQVDVVKTKELLYGLKTAFMMKWKMS